MVNLFYFSPKHSGKAERLNIQRMNNKRNNGKRARLFHRRKKIGKKFTETSKDHDNIKNRKFRLNITRCLLIIGVVVRMFIDKFVL